MRHIATRAGLPGDDIPHHGPTRARWEILALLMAFSFASHFNRVSMATAGDSRIMAQDGLSPTQMGWIYSAFLLAYTVAMIPGGLIIDRFGARAALLIVGGGSALFGALTGVVGLRAGDATRLFLGLLIVRALMGLVSAPLHPACARAVSQSVPAGLRSRCNGLVTGAALAGVAVTHVGFGALIGRFGWQRAFLIAGGLTAALALIWKACTPPGRPVAPVVRAASPAGRSWRSWDRSLVLLTLSYAAIGYFQYLFFYWMNYYFQSERKLPEPTSRSYAAIPPLTMAASMPLGGWLADRLEQAFGVRRGRPIVPVAGMLAGAGLLLLGVVARDPRWIVAWFSLALGAIGTAEGPFWATAIDLGGRKGGTSAALFNTGGNAGGLLAPVVTPWVGQLFGWPWAVALGAVVCLLGAVLWAWIDPRERPSKEAPDPIADA